MKKVLLASTALVAFAGAAAAEVSLSGYAEIGVLDDGVNDLQFHSDLDVKFSLSGESDNGLSFGATIDLDEVGDDCKLTTTGTGTTASSWCVGGDPISHNGRGSGVEEHSVWVSGSFGKVTLGDTDGAFDWALQEIYMGTALADDHSTHSGAYWNSGLDGTYDGQVMRYEYSFGDFAAAVSAELDDTGTGDAAVGLGVKWSGDMGGVSLGVGVAAQSNNSTDMAGISVQAKMDNGVQVNLGYADLDGNDWMGIGLGYSSGALLAQVNYGEYDSGESGYGVVVNYDLGGGAVAMLGVGDGDASSTFWSAGLGLSF